jgi:hypothetical protein
VLAVPARLHNRLPAHAVRRVGSTRTRAPSLRERRQALSRRDRMGLPPAPSPSSSAERAGSESSHPRAALAGRSRRWPPARLGARPPPTPRRHGRRARLGSQLGRIPQQQPPVAVGSAATGISAWPARCRTQSPMATRRYDRSVPTSDSRIARSSSCWASVQANSVIDRLLPGAVSATAGRASEICRRA